MIVLKVGGSAFDLGPSCIRPLATAISDVGRTEFVVLTVGGGPPLDVLKQARDEYGLAPLVFEELAPSFVAVQAHILGSLIPCRFVLPADFGVLSSLSSRAGVVVLAQSPDSSVPPSESDAHTLRIAELLEVGDVLFAKDAQGIFDRDPRLGGRRLYREITMQELRNHVSRVGPDGRDEHLIENRALDVFGRSMILKSVGFMDCKVPEELYEYVRFRRVTSRIIR